MNIHWLQHVHFEGLGLIYRWVEENEHSLSCTRLFQKESLPSTLDDFDLLIIMGGPMGIYDEEEFPWLVEEKKFITRCIKNNKMVLGICLGAQLLADALGARVRPNVAKEIGWYTIERESTVPQILKAVLPQQQKVFHWHGDTFSLPERAVRLYSSQACTNQAFSYENRVIALQFHLEISALELAPLIENCHDELQDGEWIQQEETLLRGAEIISGCREMLFGLLDLLATQRKEEAVYE